jgi:hypothetical protein
VAVSVTTTQAKILNVENARGRVSIEADIPALGQYPTRFIRWVGSGNAPAIGAEVMATMEPTTRQSRFLKDGTFTGEAIDGEEMPWQVNWQMTGAEPLAGGNGAGVGNTTGAAQTPRSGAPGAANGAVWVDANLRHRVDAQMVNDREAVRLAIAFGSSEGGNIIGDIGAVLEMAGQIATWLNTRFEVRMGGESGSSLVTEAQSLGAVVTEVQAAPDAPEIKNEAELRAWVEKRGWSREAVIEVIASVGAESASEYLASGGHTAQGLALILAERLA